jgi:hypothetical protein
VTRNFTEAGVGMRILCMVITQTIQETVDSEMVRQLFEAGVLQSGFGINLP